MKLSKNKSIDEYIGDERIIMKSNATDVVALERGNQTISHDKKGALTKILTLNRYEFNYHKAPTLVALSYFNPDISPEVMYDCEKKILGMLLERCEFTCVVTTNALDYSDLVFKELGK